ncbi:MAG: DUF308 domain-containing protein [Clostridia bacterium]|nr:DUF308 domain-containing protein [Clostridia bacterium]
MAKRKTSNSALATSLLYIIIGVLLIVFRSQTLGWAITVAGAVFVAFGIVDLLRRNYTSGAINLAIGIAILVLGRLAAQVVLLVMGILIAVKGLVALIEALNRKRKNLMLILFAIFSIVVGLMLAFGNGFDIMVLIVGILLTIDGVLGLFSALKK